MANEGCGVRLICKVCTTAVSRYTCPRCNLNYCSIKCYKQHSDRCTEAFYSEQASEQLKMTKATAEERKKMLQILKRVHQNENQTPDSSGSSSLGDYTADNSSQGGSASSDDEEDGRLDNVLSEETLRRLQLKAQANGGNLEVTEDDLTPEELQAFDRALASGRLSGMVQPWQPWWELPEARELQLTSQGTPLVAVVGVPTGETEAAGGSCSSNSSAAMASTAPGSILPIAALITIPPLSTLTSVRPSSLLRWQLLELTYAYCFVLRLYNGEPLADPHGAASVAMSLTDVLLHTAPGTSPKGGPQASGSTSASGACCPAGTPGCSGHETQIQAGFSRAASEPGPDRCCGVCSGGVGDYCSTPGSMNNSMSNSPSNSVHSLGRMAGDSTAPQSEAPHHRRSGSCPSSSSESRPISASKQASGAGPLAYSAPPANSNSGHAARSAAEALLSCMSRACRPPAGDVHSRAWSIWVLNDISALLHNGRASVLLLLADLRRVLEAALQEVDSHLEKAEATGRKASAAPGRPPRPALGQPVARALRQQRKALAAGSRKLLFFLAWTNEQEPELFVSLGEEVQAQWRLQASTLDRRHVVGMMVGQEGGARHAPEAVVLPGSRPASAGQVHAAGRSGGLPLPLRGMPPPQQQVVHASARA